MSDKILIRGIAFDLEGTMVDVEAAHHGAYLKLARELGIDVTFEQAFDECPHLVGGPFRRVAAWLIQRSGRSEVRMDWLRARKREHFLELRDRMDIRPRDGLITFLEACVRRGIAVSVGTATTEEDARFLLDNSGLSVYFPADRMVFHGSVKRVKPEPDVFLKTARLMGVLPSQQLVFEDSARGIIAARAAGSRVVGIATLDNAAVLDSLRRAGAEEVFTSWHDVDIESLLPV